MYTRENRYSGARIKRRVSRGSKRAIYEEARLSEEYDDLQEGEEEELAELEREAEEEQEEVVFDLANPKFRKQLFTLAAFTLGKYLVARVCKMLGGKLFSVDVLAEL